MIKKFNDLESKYNEALDIISEMKTGSKAYVEKIETLMRELNIANRLLEDYSKMLNQETSIVTDQITTSLLTDSKQLFKTYWRRILQWIKLP
jgi:gamma-glutamyl phosphate reductase